MTTRLLVLAFSFAVAFAASSTPAAALSFAIPLWLSGSPAPLSIDDKPRPLKPRQEQTEADRDHIEALALYATARSHELREEYAEALRGYERAARRDPQSVAAIEGVVVTATRLERYDEAARYASGAAKLPRLDPLVLARLVIYLADKGSIDQALAIYEKAMASHGRSKPVAADILLQMEIGQLYFAGDKPKEAAKCFAAVLHALEHPRETGLRDDVKKALMSEPGATRQMIGECFLAAGRLGEAETCFREAEQAAPNKALRQFNLARIALARGKPAEAETALDRAFADHLTGQGVAPYAILAEVLNKLGKKDQLLAQLEKLRVSNPKDLPLGYYIARQYRDSGKTDKAESLYLELLKTTPTLTGYRELADIYRRGKRFDALLTALGESVDKLGVLDTLDGEVQPLAADADMVREIASVAKKKLQAGSDKFSFGERMATALLALEAKQYDLASEFFRLALEARPQKTEEAFLVWGVGLLTGDRAVEAAKVFQRAIDEKALPADNPTFQFYLAGALALDNRIGDALSAARTAAERKKDSPRYAARPAWVLNVGKRYEQAEKAYRELLNRFDADRSSPETRDVVREARLSLSNIAVIKNDLAAAERWIEEVLDEFPNDAGAMNDLAYLWVDQNKHLARADRMIHQAVAAEPDNTAYRDSLGWLLFRQGKYEQAAVELEKAASGPKPDGTVLDHLGDTYAKLNQRDKAVAEWRKAAEAFRREKETDKAVAVEKKSQGK